MSDHRRAKPGSQAQEQHFEHVSPPIGNIPPVEAAPPADAATLLGALTSRGEQVLRGRGGAVCVWTRVARD